MLFPSTLKAVSYLFGGGPTLTTCHTRSRGSRERGRHAQERPDQQAKGGQGPLEG